MTTFKFDSSESNSIHINLNNRNTIFTTLDYLSNIDFSFENYIINIEYKCSNYVDCDSYLVIVALVNELKRVGKAVVVNFNTDQECSTIRYASRIDFFKHTGILYQENFQRRNTSDSLLEITHINKDCMGLSDELLGLFESNFRLSEEELEPLIFSFDELICNATLHSASNNGGYIYCQKFKKSNFLNIIIADCGMGVKSTLNRKYPDYNNAQSLNECIKFGVTCGNGRGHGLYLVAELLMRNKGKFCLISGENHIFTELNEKKVGYNAHWQGTIVKCSFNLNEPLPIRELFDELNYS